MGDRHRENGSALRTGRRRKGEPDWAGLPDKELLDLRLCDLGLRVEGTVLEQRVERLYEELASRDIRLRPHVWLGEEWFSPDGVPGIGIPFYLAHERLIRLEKKIMKVAEGASQHECMKVLRHETGHAICAAFRLHYKPGWREMFGLHSDPYPEFYTPKPRSRNFVHHLGWWYAQAHPTEDFAETFAVWLTPGSRWKQRYKGWKALRKLERVDELMQQLAGEVPPVRSRRLIDPLSQLPMTIREYYRRRRHKFGEDWPEFYDRDLRRIFSDDPKFADRPSAAQFLRRVRPTIRQRVARWTDEHPYTIDQVLRDMIDQCKEQKLRLAIGEREATIEAMLMVTVQTMNYLFGAHEGFAM